MNKNIIGMASDHAGFEMKEAIKSRLEKAGYADGFPQNLGHSVQNER